MANVLDLDVRNMQEKVEYFEDEVLSTLKNGIVSSDTKLITKALMYVGVQIAKLTAIIVQK